jgi:hypothetical protein
LFTDRFLSKSSKLAQSVNLSLAIECGVVDLPQRLGFSPVEFCYHSRYILIEPR